MYKQHHIGNQHGGTTLAMTVILLFVMTLVTLYVAKTSIKEQQISANQYRAEQSLSTANAALDWGVAYYTEAGGFACDERLVGVLDNYFTSCPPPVIADKATVCTITAADPTKCTFTYKKSNQLYLAPDVTEDSHHKIALSIGSSEMYYAFVDNGEGCDAADGDTDGLCAYIPVKGSKGEAVVDDAAGEHPPVYAAEIKIVGVGHSDDDTGKRIVSMDLDTSNIFGEPGLGSSAFPLISKATSGANASITIINRYDNRTIWSGNDLDISGSTNTYVLEEGLGWNCNDIEHHDDCVTSDTHAGVPLYAMPASDGVNTVNADIVDADSNLANLEADDFFKNFFGKTKTAMKQLARDAGLYATADGNGNLTYTDGSGNNAVTNWAGLADYTPLVWIEVPAGVDYTPNGTDMSQLGTEIGPMVLIVNGNLKVGGTGNTGLILVGALYVTGTWDSSANMSVQGMVVVETDSDLGGAGTPTLIYDADLFSGKMGPPPGNIAGTTPGSWKDWE